MGLKVSCLELRGDQDRAGVGGGQDGEGVGDVQVLFFFLMCYKISALSPTEAISITFQL